MINYLLIKQYLLQIKAKIKRIIIMIPADVYFPDNSRCDTFKITLYYNKLDTYPSIRLRR